MSQVVAPDGAVCARVCIVRFHPSPWHNLQGCPGCAGCVLRAEPVGGGTIERPAGKGCGRSLHFCRAQYRGRGGVCEFCNWSKGGVDSLAAKRHGDYVDQNDEHGVRFEGEAEECIRVEGSTALL